MRLLLLCLALSHATGFRPAGPRLVTAPARAATPHMALEHMSSLIADAAILLPDTDTAAAAAAATVAADDGGWFNTIIVKPFEGGITGLHDALQFLGIQQAYGPSIIAFTVGIKLLLYPLTKQQIESTTKMQAIAPAAKVLQDKYRDRDPARLNQELQKLYADNQVNPLAGCLPALAQIPLFIGLYRSLLALAKEDKLTEPFLWLPSLEGPVADYTQGITWLKDGWVNGAPPLGWHDTLAYLVLPVLLVISQYISTALLTPKTDDPAQQQSQAILKFLPLMIGWFSLNVPSGLGLYWITNNVVTTATTLIIRNNVDTTLVGAPAGAAVATGAAQAPKAQGFGRKYGEVIKSSGSDGTTVTIKPPGASAVASAPVEVAATTMTVDAVATDSGSTGLGGDVPAPAPTRKPKKAKKRKGKRT